MLKRLFLTLITCLIMSACSQQEEEVQSEAISTGKIDLLIHNAKIYTLDWPDPDANGVPHDSAPFVDNRWRPDASVVAVNDGMIVDIGENGVFVKHKDSASRVVDLNGATLLPGFIDSHTHLVQLGRILHIVNLTDVETPSDAVDRITAFAKDIAPGDWIIGRGWDEGLWANDYPTKEILDAAFPDNPVYLQSLHSFAVWANSMALDRAGIDKDKEAPVGGEIRRDDNGDPTGIFLNRATTLFADVLPQPDQEAYRKWFYDAMLQMNQDGFVAVHEAGVDGQMMAALQTLREQDKLPVRIYAMISARDGDLVNDWLAKGPHTDPAGFLDVVSVKAYYDGALGSRGARLLEDYSDLEGHRGLSGSNYGFNKDRVDALIERGFQVGVHAIGDAGNRETLEYLAKHIEGSENVKALRHRVEHAQVVHPDDFHHFERLGLIASMEPPHAVEDMAWAEARVGPQRIRGAYAWRTFRENGVPITFNSDLPGSSHSLFYGLHAAVNRQNKAKEPIGGWYPEQAVSIEEAIRGYTIWAAYAGFREENTGTITKGKWADFTVLNMDPFKVATESPDKLLEGSVLMTVVNGEVLYENLN